MVLNVIIISYRIWNQLIMIRLVWLHTVHTILLRIDMPTYHAVSRIVELVYLLHLWIIPVKLQLQTLVWCDKNWSRRAYTLYSHVVIVTVDL